MEELRDLEIKLQLGVSLSTDILNLHSFFVVINHFNILIIFIVSIISILWFGIIVRSMIIGLLYSKSKIKSKEGGYISNRKTVISKYLKQQNHFFRLDFIDYPNLVEGLLFSISEFLIYSHQQQKKMILRSVQFLPLSLRCLPSFLLRSLKFFPCSVE